MPPFEKRVIVTGAAGFIGSAVVRHLNDLGISDILLVDDIEQSEKWKNLLGKKFYDFISKRDLFAWLEKHIQEVGGIIHLGACSDTTERDGDFLMENNFRFTQSLCEIALKADIRFIYASSAATYGDGSMGFSDSLEDLERLRPLNLYGFSKHFFDLWAKQQGHFEKIVGLKYFNVFGPNENHKGNMASMVFKMVPQIEEKGKIRLFKSNDPKQYRDGEQCRDFIYVKDVAKLTCDFLFNQISGIFNIGRGCPTTWNELASALFKALGKEEQIEYIPMPRELEKQYQNYTCADVTKLQKVVGKSPYTFEIEEAVCDYVQGHLLGDVRW